MLRVDGLKLRPGDDEALLRQKAAEILRVSAGQILALRILRRSVDAREAPHLVYAVAVTLSQEEGVYKRCRDKRVSRYAPERYSLPKPVAPPSTPPIVVGAGPAGLFAALVLARCGARPILLERGRCVEQR